MKPESRLKVKVLKELRSLPNVWAVKVQQLSIVGTPDILACISGRFIALELKASSQDKTTVAQSVELHKISQANGIYFVVHPGNWQFVLTAIKKVLIDQTSESNTQKAVVHQPEASPDICRSGHIAETNVVQSSHHNTEGRQRARRTRKS